MSRMHLRWPALITMNVVVWVALGVHTSTRAEQQIPFANAVQQRAEMVAELKEIKTLLKEQNTLLRSVLTDQATNGRAQP